MKSALLGISTFFLLEIDVICFPYEVEILSFVYLNENFNFVKYVNRAKLTDKGIQSTNDKLITKQLFNATIIKQCKILHMFQCILSSKHIET